MIGRKAMVGLSLVCALLFSAITVQSAAGTAGTNITAFTCAKVAEGKEGEFKDAHCNEKIATKDGYEHKVLSGKTEVETTNETTGGAKSTGVLEGSPFKVATKIECKTMTGNGTAENSEPKPKVHKITGSGTSNFTNCTVVKPTPCTVKEITVSVGSVEALEGLTGPKGEANAMGGEVRALAGKPFATIELEGASCPLKGSPFPVEGSAVVTSGPGTAEAQNNKHSGATAVYTPAMSSLTAAGRPATIEVITTVRMKDATKAAITSTTVT
jgi:hypothetical protein